MFIVLSFTAKGSTEELINSSRKKYKLLLRESLPLFSSRLFLPIVTNQQLLMNLVLKAIKRQMFRLETLKCSIKLKLRKSKQPDRTNFGFRVSDGIGCLQIIKNIDLEELRELGSGTFGTVYHGKWRSTDVAIKHINDRCFAGKPSEQERMIDDFWNEATKLADLHHPNVVAFYGVVIDGPGGSVATVTKYMVNGSLRNALQKNERNLDKHKRLLIAMDVAFGMEYLHGKYM